MNNFYDKFLPRDRLETLTDGAYTVALTLLVTSIGLPSGELTDTEFNRALLNQIPIALTWLLSASVILINWIGFVHITQFTDKLSRPLLHFGLAQIIVITLLPFSTSLIGEHGQHPVSAVIYTLNLWIITLIAAWHVAYVQNNSFVQAPNTDPAALKSLAKSSRVLFYGTTVALVLSHVLPGWNLLAYVTTKAWTIINNRNLTAVSE